MNWMNEDFLLQTETAKRLYHDCAEQLPILDYHCHISPAEIAENRQYQSITELWLGGDHYKWRAMRTCGFPEELVTGEADGYEKFRAWAATMPHLAGNPLYHWTHLELKRYFGYDGIFGPETCDTVWTLCNGLLDHLRVREILARSNVEALCTTDDPSDLLTAHRQLREEAYQVKVLPAFRPDRAVNLQKPDFPEYIQKLGAAANLQIQSLSDLKEALLKRMDYFASLGCRVSDHGLDRAVFWKEGNPAELFQRALSGYSVTAEEAECYQTDLLLFFGREYARRGWVMQLHFGALRNGNTQRFQQLGPDTGFDAIRTEDNGSRLASYLNSLQQDGLLPKTILYSLNPTDNAMLDALCGCFQDGTARGKLQHGSAWWFNDSKPGMEAQLTSLASIGVLGQFVGMLTDSRSFLSYTRHEYFRRILCNLMGHWVESGEYPAEPAALRLLVRNICYQNAKDYFEL